MKKLSKRITKFINKYACIKPDWKEDSDRLDGKYTSPDAEQMSYCAEVLLNNIVPLQCFSEWGGGGYRPYSSKEGREEHDFLVKEVYKLINDPVIKKKGRDEIPEQQKKEQVTFYIERFKIDLLGGLDATKQFCKESATNEAERKKTEAKQHEVSGLEEFYKTHPHG